MTLPTAISDPARRDLRALVPAGLVLAIVFVWIGANGGYAPETWYPSALVMLALWGVVVGAGGRVLPADPAARLALLAFAALVGLNYLSILWAGSPGDALAAANELSLYLLAAWIFAVLPWTPRSLAIALGLWSLGIAAFCGVRLAQAASAASLTDFYVNGRFSLPMDYSNATAALAVMGMWPPLVLSARREAPAWLRGIGLGLAVFLVDFSTLPQSRAALLGLILTGVLAVIVASDRLRLLVRYAVVGGALAVCLPRTVAVGNAVSAGGYVGPVLRHAATAMLVTSVVAALLGMVIGVIEDRLAAGRRPREASRPPRLKWTPRGRRALLATGAVGLLVVVAAAVVVAEPPATRFIHSVVRNGNTDASTGSSRLLSTSPEERFDYARVALHLFSGAPVLGVGSGNFGRRYDAERRFVKHSQYAHNLPLRVLSETGIVGILVFALLVGALVVGMVRVARRRRDLGRACAVIAMCVSGYFLVHSCLDWVDEFPALAVPAIAIPLATLGLADREGQRRRAGGWGRFTVPIEPRVRRIIGAGLGIAAWVVLVLALSLSYLSVRLVDRAFAVARSSPATAYHDLSVARSLNPLSADPLTSEGTIALYLGDTTRSVRAFQRSIRREDDWYPRLELGLIAAGQGRFQDALAQIDAAGRLDVNDPLVAQARRSVLAHRRIDPLAFNRLVLQEGDVTSSVQTAIR
jgi:O-Antigen ligase